VAGVVMIVAMGMATFGPGLGRALAHPIVVTATKALPGMYKQVISEVAKDPSPINRQRLANASTQSMVETVVLQGAARSAVQMPAISPGIHSPDTNQQMEAVRQHRQGLQNVRQAIQHAVTNSPSARTLPEVKELERHVENLDGMLKDSETTGKVNDPKALQNAEDEFQRALSKFVDALGDLVKAFVEAFLKGAYEALSRGAQQAINEALANGSISQGQINQIQQGYSGASNGSLIAIPDGTPTSSSQKGGQLGGTFSNPPQAPTVPVAQPGGPRKDSEIGPASTKEHNSGSNSGIPLVPPARSGS
jgi:hypothetical protein